MDIVSQGKRSWMMSRVKSRDTKPELIVRSAVHRMGFRFRLIGKGLPGKPDIILLKHKKIIFVHGCFWHQHEGCASAKKPKTNIEFWDQKLLSNVERDKRNLKELDQMGWQVLVVWECETENQNQLFLKLKRFLGNKNKLSH